MSRSGIVALVTGWTVSLVAVGVWGQGSAQAPPAAQGRQAPPREMAPVALPGDPVGPVITGDNIGFQQVSGRPREADKILGNWMVRVNGKWFEAQAPLSVMR